VNSAALIIKPQSPSKRQCTRMYFLLSNLEYLTQTIKLSFFRAGYNDGVTRESYTSELEHALHW